MTDQVQSRSLLERREAALQRLRSGGNLWLATASDRGPHLIPVSFRWDGVRLTTSTFENSRTLTNIRAQPRIYAAVSSTKDVLMIDAVAVVMAADDVRDATRDGYARASGLPREKPGFDYIQLRPERVQVWKGPAEFTNRTVMRDGARLDDPLPDRFARDFQ